jgi:hypothetical protein
LPQHVVRLIQSVVNAEFATMTADGTPIDTPLFAFPAEDLSTLDMATGLAYPAKANRVRRNPKVGVLIEGVLPGEPTISIAGMAAVRDADIQGNALRYLAETGHYAHTGPDLWPEQQKAIWYWMRIIMLIAPKQILWWDDPAQLEGAPHRWDAPADTVFPVSDPAPPASHEPAPKWLQPPWTELAEGVLARGAPGHLSLADADGFPRPFRARNIKQVEDGFTLDIQASAPVIRQGKASLSFAGRENFIGSVTPEGSHLRLKVDRVLPILPLMDGELWAPQPATHEALMGRLRKGLELRGQTMPVIPTIKPAPTPGALRRVEREAALARRSQLDSA